MKKILISLIVLILLCGCKSNSRDSADDYTISIYTDGETCVEYLKYHNGYKGGLTVRYDKYGKIKKNKSCLEEKENDK